MSFDSVLSHTEDFLAWVPAWVVGIVWLAIAAIVAVIMHAIATAAVGRALGRRHPYVLSLLARTRNASRLALVAIAMEIALASAPFDATTAGWISRCLGLVVFGLLGWIALIAVDIGAGLYLARFEIDSADNLLARKHLTQVRILRRAIETVVVVVTIGAMLMTFDAVRQYGVSLFASAGVAGIVAGLAARPLLSNLIAGVQLAVAQPIRLGDSVLVENEFGTIEEITSTYVVVKLWDLRRMIVPLSYFIEKPFQNWTRESADLVGTVALHVDYSVPVARVREKLQEIVGASPLWDGKLVKLQVNDATERTLELRALVSAANSGAVGDLRAEVREKLVAFLQADYPDALPRTRAEIAVAGEREARESMPKITGSKPAGQPRTD